MFPDSSKEALQAGRDVEEKGVKVAIKTFKPLQKSP
jgi:hypothetical protein